MGSDDIRERFAQDFIGVPLCDTGSSSSYAWSALSIQWRVTCSNNFKAVAQAEQLVAVLQVALADLAHRDLCLRLTTMEIRAQLGTVRHAECRFVPGNDGSKIDVTLPQARAGSEDTEDLQDEAIAIGLATVRQCSCLDKDLDLALARQPRAGRAQPAARWRRG